MSKTLYHISYENTANPVYCGTDESEAELWFKVACTGLEVSNDKETEVFFHEQQPGTSWKLTKRRNIGKPGTVGNILINA